MSRLEALAALERRLPQESESLRLAKLKAVPMNLIDLPDPNLDRECGACAVGTANHIVKTYPSHNLEACNGTGVTLEYQPFDCRGAGNRDAETEEWPGVSDLEEIDDTEELAHNILNSGLVPHCHPRIEALFRRAASGKGYYSQLIRASGLI